MTRELRLPVELTALREIRRRASRLCTQSGQPGFQATLADLKRALDLMEQLEAKAAAGQKYELLPPANVLDLGE